MQFEAKKKSFHEALNNVKGLTSTLEIEDGSNPAIRLKAIKKKLVIASIYGESTVKGINVTDDGECIVDMQSLQQALAVSGDIFKFSLGDGNSAASFQCGRSKGAVSLRDSGFFDTVLKDSPKSIVHIAGLKELLLNLALKAPGDSASDRSLHFDPKTMTVRGESSDGFRCVMVTAKVGSEKGFNAASLSLPQKTCDVLGKLVGDSNVGFNDGFMSVSTPGFRAAIPLSSHPALEIQEQVASWLEGQTFLGHFTIKVKELKAALSDAQSMVGPNISAELNISLSGDSTAAKISGNSEAGEIESDLALTTTSLKTEFTLQVSAPGLKECLDLYKEDGIKVSVYSETLVLDLLEESDWIKHQTTVVPLAMVIDATVEAEDEAEDEADEPDEAEDEAEDEPAKKATGKASKKKTSQTEEKVEEEDEEEEFDD